MFNTCYLMIINVFAILILVVHYFGVCVCMVEGGDKIIWCCARASKVYWCGPDDKITAIFFLSFLINFFHLRQIPIMYGQSFFQIEQK